MEGFDWYAFMIGFISGALGMLLTMIIIIVGRD